MQLIFVYITTKDKLQATQIGKVLVEEHLAACVNILDAMQSIYLWNGALQQESEAVLIAKTTESMLEKLTSRVKELHTYSCPCIISLPIQGGNNDYLSWLEQQV